jgi:hypothetical protein
MKILLEFLSAIADPEFLRIYFGLMLTTAILFFSL